MIPPPFIARPADAWAQARPVVAMPAPAAPDPGPADVAALVARLHLLHRNRARMGPRPNLTRDFGWAFATLAGISSRQIARESGVDRSRVSRVVRELIDAASPEGCKRALPGRGVSVG